MLRFVRLTWLLVRQGILAALQYRASFLSQTLGMVLNNTFWVVMWWVYFQRFPDVNGWGFRDTLVIFALSCYFFGLLHLVAGGTIEIAGKIARGELDQALSLPGSPIWHLAVGRMQVSALGDVVFGLGLAGWLFAHEPQALSLFVCLGPVSAVIFFASALVTQSVAFFVGHFEEAANDLYWGLLTFGLYPGTIYRGALKVVTVTILPAFFVYHLPVRLLTEFRWADLIFLSAATVGYLALACAFFRLGLRRYESGSLLVVRS